MLHIIRHSSKRHSLQIIALICMSSPRFGHYKKTSMQQRKMLTLALKNKKTDHSAKLFGPHVSVILDSYARCNKLAAENCSEHILKIMSYSYHCSFKIMSYSYHCSFKIMSYSYHCSFKIMRYSYRCSFKIMSCSYRCSFKIMRCSCG